MCMCMHVHALGENKCSKNKFCINITQNKLLSMPTSDIRISNHSKEESVWVLEK